MRAKQAVAPSSELTSTICFVVAVTFIVWYLQFLWNRRKLYIHARKVDGPFAFPFIGAAHNFISRKGLIPVLSDMMDTYPDLFQIWLGPKLKYVITAPQHIDTVMNSPHAIGKDELYEFFEPAVGHGLVTTTADKWKSQRKLVSGFLSQQNLQNYVSATAKFTNLRTKDITDKLKRGEEIDVNLEVTIVTLDTIYEILFGRKRPKQVTPEFSGRMMDKVMEGLWLRTYILYYQNDFIYNISGDGKKTNGYIKKFDTMIKSILQEKKKEFQNNNRKVDCYDEDHPQTFTEYMIEKLRDLNEEVMDKGVRDEIFTFIVAGSDTTSTSASFALEVLGIFPEIQQKVYEEVMSVIGDSNNIDAKDVTRLKYLERVLKESMRLFPIAPFMGRRIRGDIQLKDGTIVPEGSGVIIGALYMHRNEKVWPNPLHFDPDRFLPENVVKRQRGSYVPFSHGPRNCAGKMYGMMGLKIIIALFVKNFIITSDYKSIAEIGVNASITIRPKEGYKTHLAPRPQPSS